jgi:hypothetical protein
MRQRPADIVDRAMEPTLDRLAALDRFGCRVLRAHQPVEFQVWCDKLHAAVRLLAETDPRFRRLDLDTFEDAAELFSDVSLETGGKA